MTNNAVFSFKRMLYLARKDWLELYKGLIITTLAVMGVVLVSSLINAYSGSGEFHSGMYVPVLFLSGILFSSNALTDIHKKGKGYPWVLTPASQIEKYLERFLFSTVGIIIYTLAAYWVFSLVCEGTAWLLFKRTNPLFNPFTVQLLKTMAAYIVVQSLFFFGSIYFKKLNFIKTVLAMFIVTIVLTLLALLFFRIFFGSYFHGFSLTQEIQDAIEGVWLRPETASIITPFIKTCEIIGKILFWGITAPFFWIAGYFKLIETEVRNGV